MRMGHGRQHVEEEADAGRDVQRLLLAVLVDGQALDILQHEIGLAAVVHAGIQQPRDMRVRKPAEDLALAGEAGRATAAEHAGAEELDRNVALEAAVGPARQPNRAHAAPAQFALQHIGPDVQAGQVGRLIGCRQRVDDGACRRRVQEALHVQRRIVGQQGLEPVGQRAILRAQGRQALAALGLGQVQQLVEQGAQHGPLLLVDGGHRCVPPQPRRLVARKSRAFCQSRCTVRSVTPSASAMSRSGRPAK
ncbi:hypothetical protein ROSA5918_21850 [Roseateles saccharophilus]